MADPASAAPPRPDRGRLDRGRRAAGRALRAAGRAGVRAAGHAWRAVRHRRPRRGWRAATAWVVLGLVASVVFGVTTASVEGALGPHVTRYDVTADKTVTIDFGPLGTLQIDSPLPLTLGVRATVQEIPASVTELGQARTLQALSEDASAYVSFFSGPAAAVRDVAHALVADAVERSVLAFAALVAVWWLVRWLLGGQRARELGDAVAARGRPLRAGAAVVLVGATVLTSSVAPRDRPASQEVASAVFDGTPLAGARVTGRLGGVIDTYGAYAVEAWRANEAFYQDADAALVVAWEEWEADEQQRLATQARKDAALGDAARRAAAAPESVPGSASAGADAGTPGAGPPPDPADPPVADPRATGAGDDAPADGTAVGDAAGASAATGAAAEDGPGARRTPGTSASVDPEQPPVDPVVLLVVSDLHCNVGMAPLVGSLARLAEVDAVLDAGDTTVNGTSVEQYCVTSFARAVPRGVELLTSPGNHDSPETTGHYARAGATVLDGSVVEVAGVRVLGDSDPNATRVGAGGTAVAGDESPAEAGRRLAEVACDDGEVDLLLVHTPTVGDAALDDGCVPAQVSGHYHRRVGPEQVGLGVRYVSSSTAGATLNQPTLGPLRGAAELTLLRFDPEARRFVDLQVVRVAPDTSVTVGPRRPWPVVVPPDEETDAADGGAADGGSAGDGSAGAGAAGAGTPSGTP